MKFFTLLFFLGISINYCLSAQATTINAEERSKLTTSSNTNNTTKKRADIKEEMEKRRKEAKELQRKLEEINQKNKDGIIGFFAGLFGDQYRANLEKSQGLLSELRSPSYQTVVRELKVATWAKEQLMIQEGIANVLLETKNIPGAHPKDCEKITRHFSTLVECIVDRMEKAKISSLN